MVRDLPSKKVCLLTIFVKEKCLFGPVQSNFSLIHSIRGSKGKQILRSFLFGCSQGYNLEEEKKAAAPIFLLRIKNLHLY